MINTQTLESGQRFTNMAGDKYILQRLPDVDLWMLVGSDGKGWTWPKPTALEAFGSSENMFTLAEDSPKEKALKYLGKILLKNKWDSLKTNRENINEMLSYESSEEEAQTGSWFYFSGAVHLLRTLQILGYGEEYPIFE